MTPLTLTTIAIAILSAWYDKVRIAGGHEIMHVPRWVIRAALVSIAALLFGHPWMVLGLWGLFSAVFRFALNRWRGLDWRYVSPSNWYDRTFMEFAGYWWSSWDGFDTNDVHRAGTIAYIVEVVAFVVVLFLHLK